MTDEQQEADRLIELFRPHSYVANRDFQATDKAAAKACAAICCQEILRNNFWESDPNKNNYFIYWNKVLNRINETK